jgi:hypothetical protein
MVDEPHEVVKLLLARMESHPEEFSLTSPSYHDRWYNHLNEIHAHGNEADKAALTEKLRDIRLAKIHEQVMDELLNGDDRRAQEKEEEAYERKLEELARKKKILQNSQTAMQHIDAEPEQISFSK